MMQHLHVVVSFSLLIFVIFEHVHLLLDVLLPLEKFDLIIPVQEMIKVHWSVGFGTRQLDLGFFALIMIGIF